MPHIPSSAPFRPLFTPRRTLAIMVVCVAVVALGGCASLERAADKGWAFTSTTVASLLRPAPKAVPEFHHAAVVADTPQDTFQDTGDAALNTPRLERMVWTAGLRAGLDAPVEYQAVNRTRDNGVVVYRPGGATPRMHRMAPAPRPAPVLAPAQDPITSVPASYVRVDGPTNPADWQACELRVGGAFIVSGERVRIASDFDACMRARGYLPEGEAQTRLELVGQAPEAPVAVAGLRGLKL